MFLEALHVWKEHTALLLLLPLLVPLNFFSICCSATEFYSDWEQEDTGRGSSSIFIKEPFCLNKLTWLYTNVRLKIQTLEWPLLLSTEWIRSLDEKNKRLENHKCDRRMLHSHNHVPLSDLGKVACRMECIKAMRDCVTFSSCYQQSPTLLLAFSGKAATIVVLRSIATLLVGLK